MKIWQKILLLGNLIVVILFLLFFQKDEFVLKGMLTLHERPKMNKKSEMFGRTLKMLEISRNNLQWKLYKHTD